MNLTALMNNNPSDILRLLIGNLLYFLKLNFALNLFFKHIKADKSFQVVSYNEYVGPVGIGNDDGEWKLFDHQGNTCTFQHSHYNGHNKEKKLNPYF